MINLKLMRIIILLILLFFTVFISQSQNGYYVTEDSVESGIEIVDGGHIVNSKFCQIKRLEDIIILTPNEVLEYGIKRNKVYISREITIAGFAGKVFLRRLVLGKIDLYYFKDKDGKRYFLEKNDSGLVHLSGKGTKRNEYKELISNFIVDNPMIIENLKTVSFNERSLTGLIKRYNSDSGTPLPFFKLGVNIGFQFNKLVPSNNYWLAGYNSIPKMDFYLEKRMVAGIFLDYPLHWDGYSVYSGASFSQSEITLDNLIDDTLIELNLTTSDVSFPLLIRYIHYLPNSAYHPYINAGGYYSYSFENTNSVFVVTPDITTYKEDDSFLNSDHKIGYSAGVGVQMKLDYRRSFFVEFRYNRLFSAFSMDATQSYSFQNRHLQLLAGINF